MLSGLWNSFWNSSTAQVTGVVAQSAVANGETVTARVIPDEQPLLVGVLGGGNFFPLRIQVEIFPSEVCLEPSETQQFSATVTGTTTKGVTWSVDEIPGGNDSVGTISSTGLYTAPPDASLHVVTATSVIDTSKSASAQVTVSTTCVNPSQEELLLVILAAALD